MEKIENNSDGAISERRPRTAVLVIHGIGNQRALETVRGIVDAVWLKDPGQAHLTPQIWTHPEPSGVDIDLSVMTTSDIHVDTPAGGEERSIDFHEFYWAHLMSETRAIAVLLWLFELVRKGPQLKKGMNALWYAASIFLCLVLASAVLVILQLVNYFALAGSSPEILALAPVFALAVWACVGLVAAIFAGSFRLSAVLAALVIVSGVLFYAGISWGQLPLYATLYLAPALSVLVALIALGWRGCWMMIAIFAIGCVSVAAYFWLTGTTNPSPEWGAWSLAEQWSYVVAFFMIAIYLFLNAVFLQSFLGDAARYFRNSPANVAVRREIRKQAVETLDKLHTSGRYDRIIVVAHSLGSVIAYDMLRSYYSRICGSLPSPTLLPEAGILDEMTNADSEPEIFRKSARTLVRQIASVTVTDKTTTKWLVTDFVTLGAALTHAKYLMCSEPGGLGSDEIFARRVERREYPICPPARIKPDGLLLFTPPGGSRRFHHGGLFAMTRWTNLYFPMKELLWGDAIGGPLKQLFGACVRDKAVSTSKPAKDRFFTHTAYWRLDTPGGVSAPHLIALREAINLKDGES